MRSQPLPSASDEHLSSKFLINIINDLPDGVLVEILCRLPYKYARRNKRVCKRWLALISDSYFAACFLCMQIDKNKPITLLRTLLFSNRTAKASPAGFTFRHIIFDALLWKTSIVALHFIPRFKGTKEKLVVAMYNDLVLCCLTKEDPHKYYICNPNAMQCVALPPAPPHHKIAQVGFICDPYYASQEQDNDGGTGTSITTNDEYRCRVVRIIQLGNYLSQFKVDIFSSETRGQRYGRNTIDFWPWRDVWTYVIPCWPTLLPRVGLPPLSRKRKGEEKQTAIVS